MLVSRQSQDPTSLPGLSKLYQGKTRFLLHAVTLQIWIILDIYILVESLMLLQVHVHASIVRVKELSKYSTTQL